MIDNEWTRLLEHMRKTLAEREEFIQSVISDNVKLQGANDDMLEALKDLIAYEEIERVSTGRPLPTWIETARAAVRKAGESC
jgi:hypothetical protein